MKYFAAFVYFSLLLLCLIPKLLPNLIGGLLGTEPPNIGDVSLLSLLLVHLGLVLLAEFAVLLIGVPLAIVVTRTGRMAWMRLAEALAGLGQTVPTLAILALAVPTLGLGVPPTMLGLVLYGLMPVVSNGIAGLVNLDKSVLDAATGMGMTERQRLYKVELPLALPVFLAGVRTSTVYNVATAVIGAALGAGGLGLLIINGLSQQNTGLVLVGAILSALLALTLDALLALVSQETVSL
jgi:osmoprotectant transport system permease protein